MPEVVFPLNEDIYLESEKLESFSDSNFPLKNEKFHDLLDTLNQERITSRLIYMQYRTASATTQALSFLSVLLALAVIPLSLSSKIPSVSSNNPVVVVMNRFSSIQQIRNLKFFNSEAMLYGAGVFPYGISWCSRCTKISSRANADCGLKFISS